VNPKQTGSWGGLTRGEQIALVLRLAVLVALAATLIRALAAFWELCDKRDLPVAQVCYIPAALVAALALAARSIWRALSGLCSERRAQHRENGRQDGESRP